MILIFMEIFPTQKLMVAAAGKMESRVILLTNMVGPEVGKLSKMLGLKYDLHF